MHDLVTSWSQLKESLRKVSAAVSTLWMYLEEAWEASVLPLNHSRPSADSAADTKEHSIAGLSTQAGRSRPLRGS